MLRSRIIVCKIERMNRDSKPFLLTVEQIREVDRVAIEQFGMSGLVLMENAGRGAAEAISKVLDPLSKVLILCGCGNNGGDGLVIARHLYSQGHAVRVWLVGETNRLSSDARSNYEILSKSSVSTRWIRSDTEDCHPVAQDARVDVFGSDVIVDALLGTGAVGTPRGILSKLIRWANESDATRIAIDVPTGLDAGNGFTNDPTFIAHETITFVAWKTGFMNECSKTVLGTVRVMPIGILPEVITRVLQRN